MASRFRLALRASDVVARMGGDEFVVLAEDTDGAGDAEAIARKLLAAAIAPLTLSGQECRITASIGIALYPTHGNDEQTLMKCADIAMYQAKEDGKNTFHLYTPALRSQSLERLTLESNLRQALERDEFTLHYQPKVDFTSGHITGVEALLRWNSPALGAVPPGQFIALAEETGLIVPIGQWVLRTACAQAAAWAQAGLPPVPMAVNVSARQFADDRLYDDIAAAVADAGLGPGMLEIELTEGMVMQDVERAVRLLSAIQKLGVRVAIDDFGTGYSSLAQLRRFPVDTLKVDRSFVRNIEQDPEGQAITEAIIAMGRTLSLTVIAEGVETQEEAEFLRAHACDEMQGFYFSRPVTGEAFAQLLAAHPQQPGVSKRPQ
jgi:predicted signal transduction protein with EAL and GGDEF domain